MSQAAWSALADRFAALAAEQDFDLWLYSVAVHHYPPNVTQGEMRFMSAAHLVRERTGFTGLALTGSPALTGDEFAQLNRFRWLTWAAGRLLSTTAARPELEWLFAAHRENTELCEVRESGSWLRHVVATSAATARRIAEGRCPSVRPLRDPTGGLQPGSWQQPLLSLRNAFWNHANARFDFHLELHGYTNPGPFGVGGGQLRQIQEQFALTGRGVNTQEGPQLIYWTDSEPGGNYTELAQHAGRQLPEQFIPSVRLLPPGVSPIRPDYRPDPLVAWSEFLWLANPLNYQRCSDSCDVGARKAVWKGGNPFMASALAIDQFVRSFGDDTLELLNRRMIEVCPWFSHSEDRSAALAAVNDAFQPLPPTESPQPPAPTGEAINPQSTEPYTLNDIRDLLRYRRANAEFMTRLRSMTPPAILGTKMAKSAGLDAFIALNHWSALNCPQAPRLTEDEAVVQPVYHWLVDAARADNVELNEDTLRLLVGRVAMATKRPVPDLMGLPLDDFDRVRVSLPSEINSELLQPAGTPNQVRTSRDEPPRNPQPQWVAADLDTVTWNLSNIFTQTVDLAESLDCEHDRSSASGDPDRIGFQLRRALNPRSWPLLFEFKNGTNGELLPGWLPSIRVATCLCADTKRALESLALLACDVDGAIEAFPHDPEEDDDTRYIATLDTARRRLRYARSLFGSTAGALWVVMDSDERTEVAGHVQAKARRLFGWAEMPTELPSGLQRYEDHIRNFDDGGAVRDYRLWRTVRLATIPDVAPDVLPVTSVAAPKREGGNLLMDGSTNSPDPQEATKFVLAIMGTTYLVCGFGETGHLPGSLKGLGVIARLVRTPGVAVPWAELDPGILKDSPRTAQATYDEMGLNDLRERCLRLQTEIATADDEIERADSQRQLDELTAHVLPAIGLQGRARDMNNLTDKLRPKIWGRIKTVNDKLRRAMPPMPNLAKHFEGCITSTTDGFIYDPPAPVPHWQTEPDKK